MSQLNDLKIKLKKKITTFECFSTRFHNKRSYNMINPLNQINPKHETQYDASNYQAKIPSWAKYHLVTLINQVLCLLHFFLFFNKNEKENRNFLIPSSKDMIII